jgi:hypothetical protein
MQGGEPKDHEVCARNDKEAVEGNGTTSEDGDRLRRRHFAGIHWSTNRIVAHSISNKSDNFIFSEVGHGNSEEFVFRKA